MSLLEQMEKVYPSERIVLTYDAWCKLMNDVEALERVAKAAKVVLPEIPHGQTLSEYEHKQVIELMEALKEVRHLFR